MFDLFVLDSALPDSSLRQWNLDYEYSGIPDCTSEISISGVRILLQSKISRILNNK